MNKFAAIAISLLVIGFISLGGTGHDPSKDYTKTESGHSDYKAIVEDVPFIKKETKTAIKEPTKTPTKTPKKVTTKAKPTTAPKKVVGK